MIPLKLYMLAGFEYCPCVYSYNLPLQSRPSRIIPLRVRVEPRVQCCLPSTPSEASALYTESGQVITKTIITSQLQVGKRAKKRQKGMTSDLCSGFYSLLKSYREYLA